jgi:hypothetical protein
MVVDVVRILAFIVVHFLLFYVEIRSVLVSLVFAVNFHHIFTVLSCLFAFGVCWTHGNDVIKVFDHSKDLTSACNGLIPSFQNEGLSRS